MVRPRPTWAAESPTIWVKKTALPVRNVALADREEDRLRRQPARQRRRRQLGDASQRGAPVGRRSGSSGGPSVRRRAILPRPASVRRVDYVAAVADWLAAAGRARAAGRRDLRLDRAAQAGAAVAARRAGLGRRHRRAGSAAPGRGSLALPPTYVAGLAGRGAARWSRARAAAATGPRRRGRRRRRTPRWCRPSCTGCSTTRPTPTALRRMRRRAARRRPDRPGAARAAPRRPGSGWSRRTARPRPAAAASTTASRSTASRSRSASGGRDPDRRARRSSTGTTATRR